MTRCFAYESVAREAGIPPDALASLSRLMLDEFPNDDMLYELHMLRACTTVRDGRASLEDILTPLPAIAR